MKLLVLFLFLLSARNVQSQYVLGKKHDFWGGYKAETACLNRGRDTLTLVLNKEKTAFPLDSVDFLTFRDRKSWWPYLLTASIVGVSTYTYFHFAGHDDAWYTAEGKARFAGFFWGGIVLCLGAVGKEMVETHLIIHSSRGIDLTEALLICSF